jgi:hypothetical protein
MEEDRAAEELKVIRQLMERPVRYSTMSGLSGILAGCAALAGLGLDWRISGAYWESPYTAMWLNMLVWVGVFCVAALGVVALTRIRERRQGMPFWSAVKRRILLTILPPFAVGAALTLVIVVRWHLGVGSDGWGLIPAIWMLFYGLALWQAGEFSVPEVRFMGAAFLLGGLATAMFFSACPYWAMGVAFGGFHILYGLIVWARHGG